MINNYEIYTVSYLISELLGNNNIKITLTYLNKCFDDEEYMFTKIFFDYLSLRYDKEGMYPNQLRLFAHSKVREFIKRSGVIKKRNINDLNSLLYEEHVNQALFQIMGNCITCSSLPVNHRISCNYNNSWPLVNAAQANFRIDSYGYSILSGPDMICVDLNPVAALVMKKEYFFPMLLKFLSTKDNEHITYDSQMFEFFYIPEEIEKIMSLSSNKRKMVETTLYNINEAGIPFVKVSQERMNKLMPVNLKEDILRKEEYGLDKIMDVVQSVPQLL